MSPSAYQGRVHYRKPGGLTVCGRSWDDGTRRARRGLGEGFVAATSDESLVTCWICKTLLQGRSPQSRSHGRRGE